MKTEFLIHRSFSGEICLYQSTSERKTEHKTPRTKANLISFCKENQGRCPGSWWWAVVWGAMISSLPTQKMGMDPQCWVLVMLGWFAAQGTWHKACPEVPVPGRGRTALLIAWAEAESRGGTSTESWAPSPGGCQLELSWLSSCSAGGIPGWPLCCILGHEVPFGSHKLYMKCQSTGWAQVNAVSCVIPFQQVTHRGQLWPKHIHSPAFLHTPLLFIFPPQHPHLISAQEKCFLRPHLTQDWHYHFGIFTGLLGVRKREWLGSECTIQA